MSDRLDSFISFAQGKRVLEIGALGSVRRLQSTEYIGLDIAGGEGVNVVADAHELSRHFPPGSFDAVLSTATFEHLRRPWIVVQEIAKVTRAGGLAFVQTHQTFPYHPYPQDYFRFSREAIGELFSADHGWEVIESAYEFPCKIVPLENVFTHARDWNFAADAWLNVECLARRL